MTTKSRATSRYINDFYTLGEEIANGVTHGVGAALSVAGLTALLIFAIWKRDPTQIVSFSIYGGSLIFNYVASTLYHSFQHPPTKHVLRIIDHSAIYLLIAGTYTPFLLISVKGAIGWRMLIIVWTLAIVGITFKTFFINRFEVVATIAYVLMGWICVFAFRAMIANLPTAGLYWLIAGGLSYTGGVVFYMWHKLPYNHAIWHLFVLGGSICHYISILTISQ